MIIRPNNMTPNDFQKQVNSITKMKRGLNQMPRDIREQSLNDNNKPNPAAMLKGAVQLRDKMDTFKNVSKEK